MQSWFSEIWFQWSKTKLAIFAHQQLLNCATSAGFTFQLQFDFGRSHPLDLHSINQLQAAIQQHPRVYHLTPCSKQVPPFKVPAPQIKAASQSYLLLLWKVLELILKLPVSTKHFLKISLLWGLWPSQFRISCWSLTNLFSHHIFPFSCPFDYHLVPDTPSTSPCSWVWCRISPSCSLCFLGTWFPAAALPFTPAGCHFHWVPWLSSPIPALCNPQGLCQLQ